MVRNKYSLFTRTTDLVSELSELNKANAFNPFSLFSCIAQPEMDMAMVGHHFSQQQAPPNQTAPWPDSMMPIDQTSFVNQNRYQYIRAKNKCK